MVKFHTIGDSHGGGFFVRNKNFKYAWGKIKNINGIPIKCNQVGPWLLHSVGR